MLNNINRLKQAVKYSKVGPSTNSFFKAALNENLLKFSTNSFCMKMNISEMDLINFSNKSFKTKSSSNNNKK